MLYVLLTALAGAITIVGGLVALYDYIQKRQHKGITLGITFITFLLTAIFFWASIPYIGSVSGQGANPTPTTIGNSQSTPIITSTQTQQIPAITPTPNPCSSRPDAGTVLYQADWSKDTNGWVGAGDWTALNGALVTAGNGNPPIFAPYRPGDHCIADYAIEAKITLIKYNDQQEDGFGLVIRATSDGGGYSLSICAKQKYAFGAIVASCADDSGAAQNIYKALLLIGQNFPDGGTVLGGQAFKPHVVQHVYRMEVKANTISVFVDGNRIIGPVTDNTYLLGGQVGVYSENTQLSIDSFKAIAL